MLFRPAAPASLRRALPAVALAFLASACGRGTEPAPAARPTPAPAAQAAPGPDEPLEPAPEATPLPAGLAPILQPYKGDLDGMAVRRLIRVLTVQNPILYFVDRGREVGITSEAIRAFEEELNRKLGNKVVTVHVVVLPVARAQLLPMLVDGRGDVATAQLTITPERQKLVDFSEPVATGVREVLVTGPDTPPVASLDELSGREVYLRPSSSYAEHVARLNERFAKEGKPPLKVLPAPETLEDGDILEMVNAGLVPATVVDDFIADLYTQIFPKLRKNADIASPPGSIGWAFRKGSPKLAAAVDAFVRTHKQGSLAGNVLINKYLKTTKWVRNARSDEDRKRFLAMAGFFRKYGARYRLDPLLMAAQGYQESGLDQSKRSQVGAIGVMQMLPATAKDKAVNIPQIDTLENNIHAGIKYNRWMIDSFYDEPGMTPLDRHLFAFASYNAGPGRVAGLRKEARAQGLDPDRWFNNVELVAARRIGRETVTYVSNIYKYYLAYQMIVQGQKARAESKAAAARR
ncbi:MAG TPA: lytic transglycosylase F [Vicinamibacteria bacterium]|nr:lytic transglycosylase F [Vicinamibacteria bacterium]